MKWHRGMKSAPRDKVILARGWDYGRKNGSRHYSLVIWSKDHWQGVGNETNWLYLTDWASMNDSTDGKP